jgi:type IV pilus assembly protein PilB
MELNLTPDDVRGRQFMRGRGCDNCHKSGYKGRAAIFEIMTLDDEMRELIMKNASTAILRNHARKRGMRTLRECGIWSIYEGITTIDEVVRETVMDERHQARSRAEKTQVGSLCQEVENGRTEH